MLRNFKTRILLSMSIMFSSLLTFAQDKKVDINLNLNKGNDSQWYAQPWVWIVGGAVFILLIVALTRGGKKE